MYLEYILTVSCKLQEYSLIHVYNFLNKYLHKGYSSTKELITDISPFSLSYKKINPGLYINDSTVSILLNLARRGEMLEWSDEYLKTDNIEKTSILLEFDEPNQKKDISIFRHLFMINGLLLRKHDYVVIRCTDVYYYNIQSYFSLEELLQNKCSAIIVNSKKTINDKNKNLFHFNNPIPFAKEWIPAIFLKNGNSSYETLANPIIESRKTIDLLMKQWHNYFVYDYYKRGNYNTLFARIDKVNRNPRMFFALWICYQYRDCKVMKDMINIGGRFYSLFEKYCNTPGITQILFAMLLHLRYETSSSIENADIDEVNQLFSWCCDLGDCILQIAENVIIHTEGGVLTIRSNDNWKTIANTFRLTEKPTKSRGVDYRYVRVSLIDSSQNSILDNVYHQLEEYGKKEIEKATNKEDNTQHACEEESENYTVEQLIKDSQELSYEKLFSDKEDAIYAKLHMLNSSYTVHHYGLMVYRSIVESLRGCFTLFSSAAEMVSIKSDSYVFESKEIFSPRKKWSSFPHIPGSEFDIIFKLRNKEKPESSGISSIISPRYIINDIEATPILDKNDKGNELVTFFNKELSDIISNCIKEKRSISGHSIKEDIINKASEILKNRMESSRDAKVPNPVWYFYLLPYDPDNKFEKEKTYYGRTEIAAKIIMRVIADSTDGLKIVLYGVTENQLITFVRQFAFFYHTTKGNRFMGKSQLYVVSNDYKTDVLFASDRLQEIRDYASQRRLITGITPRIEDELIHIAQREKNSTEGSVFEPYPFELLKRMEYDTTKNNEDIASCLSLSDDKCWYFDTLNTVLETDIHKSNLGCKLDNIHIQVGKQKHNRCFYETHLLFSNAYWYKVFAAYICEKILEKEPDKNKHILLCGYETYSEQMLRDARKMLANKGYIVSYVIFENSRFGQVNKGSRKRVRYIDEFKQSLNDSELLIVYIMGSSQTGDTLYDIKETMRGELVQLKDKLCGENEMSIIMVRFWSRDYPHEIDMDKSVQCLICKEVVSYPSQENPECPLCFPDKNKEEPLPYTNERPLIRTDEASVIPMMLIRPDNQNPVTICFQQENEYAKLFLEDKNGDNHKYLYYSHLIREGNHYNYYIRTAQLVHDMDMDKESDLRKWLQEVKDAEKIDARLNNNIINVILAPLHFSNEVFSSAVNEYVFDNSAYFINFDVRQEYRENFVAKFQNFCTMISCFTDANRQHSMTINFYYVDDSINTGATYQRAKSLVSSLLNQYLIPEKNNMPEVKINVFKAIIILTTRNSRSTFLPYFDYSILQQDNHTVTLPVYCFIELKMPSIWSTESMCPLCRKVNRINYLISESALTFVERHWRDKADYHRPKMLYDTKIDQEKKNKDKDTNFTRRGFRRLQCSELLWNTLKSNKNPENLYNELTKSINHILIQKHTYTEKVEYLISFLKVVTREDVIIREKANDAAMRILLSIFSLFLRDNVTEMNDLYVTINQLLFQDQENNTWRKDDPLLLYQLYQIIIARLCTMGSNVFLNEKRLVECINIGRKLLKRYTGDPNDDQYMEFICWQIKKNLASVGNNEIRVANMEAILRPYISHHSQESSENINLKYFYALFLENESNETKEKFLLPNLLKIIFKMIHKGDVRIPYSEKDALAQIEKLPDEGILKILKDIMKIIYKGDAKCDYPSDIVGQLTKKKRQKEVYEYTDYLLAFHKLMDILYKEKAETEDDRRIKSPVDYMSYMIDNASYKSILQIFCNLMGARNVYMFQAKGGYALPTFSEEQCEITILERANAEDSLPEIPLLRSEMKSFYQNNLNNITDEQGMDDLDQSIWKPNELICEIKDTLRLVRVEKVQRDNAVGNYWREPCLIAYVRLDYKDENAQTDDPPKQVFFAFMYEYDTLHANKDMLIMLDKIRVFLFFRYSLVERIERDFKGNLYGEKADAQWRQSMLSNDRAGCHLKNNAMARLLDDSKFEDNDAIRVLFSDDQENGNLKDTYELIYNNLIAMYYRKLLGDEYMGLGVDDVLVNNHEDNEENYNHEDKEKERNYYKMSDLFDFSYMKKPILLYDQDLQTELPNKLISHIKSSMPPVPGRNRNTLESERVIEKKYLRAFLIDVFSNIAKRNEEAIISVSDGDDVSDYLVVCNKVTLENEEGDENYKLKGAIELDYMDLTKPHGISLGSFAHLLHAHGGRQLKARYTKRNGCTYFCIQIPIIFK